MLLFILSFFVYIFGLFNLIGIKSSFVVPHIIYFVIGVALYFVIKRLGFNFFRSNAPFFYWVFMGLLVLTYIIGMEAKGSRRWIDLYLFKFQTSEFFKIFFILFLAYFFTHNFRRMRSFQMFLMSLFYFAVPTFIIFKQPDLGTAMIFSAVFLVMACFSRLSKKYLLYGFIVVIILAPLAFRFVNQYQRDRIVSFINPEANKDTSYNMTQAIITVGSGGLMGEGLGLGKQSRLSYLPENHTDFAFSSLIEQFGFIGGVAITFLYSLIAIILAQKIITFYQQKDEDGYFKFLYTLGFFTFFMFQMFVNIGMNTGLMPIAGVTLPLISYGGSSLVTWMIGLALLP